MVCSGVRAQALLRVRSLRRKTPHAPGEAAHIGLSSFSGISHELVQVPAPRSPVPPLGRTWQNAQRDRNESSARLAEGHFQRTTGRTTVPFSLSGRQQADGSERTAAASDSRVGSDAAQQQLVHVLLLLLRRLIIRLSLRSSSGGPHGGAARHRGVCVHTRRLRPLRAQPPHLRRSLGGVTRDSWLVDVQAVRWRRGSRRFLPSGSHNRSTRRGHSCRPRPSSKKPGASTSLSPCRRCSLQRAGVLDLHRQPARIRQQPAHGEGEEGILEQPGVPHLELRYRGDISSCPVFARSPPSSAS